MSKLRLTTHNEKFSAKRFHTLNDLVESQVRSLLSATVEDLLSILDNTTQVHWQGPVVISVGEADISQVVTVLDQLIVFFIQDLLQLDVTLDLLSRVQKRLGNRVRRIQHIDAVTLFKAEVRPRNSVHRLFLDRSTIHTVLTIDELNDITQRVSCGTIVVDHNIFQSFNQTTLDITCFSCFHSSINKTFSTSHGVEKELLRCQTSQVRVLNETLRLRRVVILREMRQGTVTETKWNTLTLHDLLTHTSRHLRDIDKRTLGSGCDHLLHIVKILQVHFCRTTSSVTGLIKNTRHIMLERLSQGHTWFRLQSVPLSIHDNFLDLLLGFLNSSSNISHGLFISNRITNTDGETVMQEPVIHDLLNGTEQLSTDLWTLLSHDSVNQTTSGCTNSFLVNDTKNDLTINNQHAFILGTEHVSSVIKSLQMDSLGDSHR